MMQQMVMLSSRPQDAYRRQGVLTASPVELVVMLYDGLKKNLVVGQRAIKKHDIQSAHDNLMKAQAIVAELMSSLDMSFEISSELFRLYDFMQWSIRNANMRKTDKSAEELTPVIEIVEDLRDAWQQIGESTRGSLHLAEA